MSGDSTVEIRKAVKHAFSGDSKTVQSDALKSDINSIMSKYVNPPPVVPADGSNANYGDFANGLSFHEAMNNVVTAQERFERLPLPVKRYCDHDPGKFLDLVMDPERRGELEELGLVEKQAPAEAPAAVERPQVEPEVETPQE